ncbi:hypothetical protein pipiens_000517, partial [Culex pipiens pipiens]
MLLYEEFGFASIYPELIKDRAARGKQQNEQFQCRANELYDALTRQDMVTAFTRGHVKLDLFKE